MAENKKLSVYSDETLKKMIAEIRQELKNRTAKVATEFDQITWDDAVTQHLPEMGKDARKAFMLITQACVDTMNRDRKGVITLVDVASLKYEHVRAIRNVGKVYIGRVNKVLEAYGYPDIPYGVLEERMYQKNSRKNF
jgi:pyruvate formate-lyase activating enzyme-like uncharacterized protein